VVQCEARRTLRQPLPNLASFSLLLGSVGLLHRAAPQDFGRAREALAELSERVPRHGASYAWLAKWHCLRIIRGLTASPETDRAEAQWRIEQALERDDTSAVAWALRGLVHGFLGKDLEAADAAYATALGHNPNEPLAWLYTATLRSWQGRGTEAAAAAEQALRLSPLDPMRYYFESLAAAGFLADAQYARAAELCRHSLKLNRGHTPTHRVLAISEMLAGRAGAARAAVEELRALEPQLTVSKYLDRYPGGRAPHARVYAEALQEAGLPH
jgi:adenylate cyclase